MRSWPTKHGKTTDSATTRRLPTCFRYTIIVCFTFFFFQFPFICIIFFRMQGQFKSRLVCLHCNYRSLKFDPFFSVTLPLPQKLRRRPVLALLYCFRFQQCKVSTQSRLVQVIFVPANAEKEPVTFVLHVPLVGPVSVLVSMLGAQCHLPWQRLRLCEVYQNKFQQIYPVCFCGQAISCRQLF